VRERGRQWGNIQT